MLTFGFLWFSKITPIIKCLKIKACLLSKLKSLFILVINLSNERVQWGSETSPEKKQELGMPALPYFPQDSHPQVNFSARE